MPSSGNRAGPTVALPTLHLYRTYVILVCQGSWPRVFWGRGTGSERWAGQPERCLPVYWLPKDEKKHVCSCRSLLAELVEVSVSWQVTESFCGCPAFLGFENRWGLIWSGPTSKAQIWSVYYKIIANLGSSSLCVSLFPLSSHHLQGLWAAAAFIQTDRTKTGANIAAHAARMCSGSSLEKRLNWTCDDGEGLSTPEWVKAERKGGEVLQELGRVLIPLLPFPLPLLCPQHFLWMVKGRRENQDLAFSAFRQSSSTCRIFLLNQHCDANIISCLFAAWGNL